MAVTKKTLFAENLDRYQTFVTDTDQDSKYFKITELPDTLTGGKNAFLIQGSEYLVPDTLIKIEIKDSQGEIIYHEPGEGIISSSVNGEYFVSEYYEGVSKVVSIHVYPDTSYGPATITILGEVSKYDSNGVEAPIPSDWENKYNVKWQRQINVNPSLVNTTKIRFYKRPSVSINETLSPIYTLVSGSKVESNVVSSFANFTISQMETFAGDVKRIKVFRTSEGDISDYDLIQDILVESKELLTSYELTGSVISNGGLFTSETLEKLWNPTTLTTQLTSSRVDNGVKLSGNGYFKYTSSINLSDTNVYELGIDAFYSASTASNLGIYVSGSNNGEYLIGTLNGIVPTKNLKDQTIQFTLPYAEPTASLYLSQSQSEWHVGNISLKLTEDTAFSPSEISFVSSMPTVIGNETYNFKFEFYDVNNNYVPVAVTQSAVFTGGNNNIGGTLSFISASASSSLSQLYAVSSSISGTMTVYSASASGSILTLSSSVSGSITIVSGSVNTLSGSVSSSLYSLSSSVSQSNATILSSSLSKVQQLANGQYSGSFIGDTVIYSPAIGGQVGYIKELFTVGDTSAARINLDARTSTRKIYIGTGTYNNANTAVYLDSGGQFSLKDKLTWDGSTLSLTGNVNLTGGTAQTQLSAVGTATGSLQSQLTSVGTATGSLLSSINSATDSIFTNSLGRITKAPTPGSTSGLYLGNSIMGFYNGTSWKTYMDNTGLFYLTGSANGNALLWDGSTLTIKGNLAVGSVVPNSAVSGLGSLALKSSVSATTEVTGLGGLATKSSVSAAEIDSNAVTNAKIAADAVSEAKIATDAVTSGKISANAIVADKIAANAIVADKIAANAVTAGKIIAGAIDADKIAANAITAGKISAGAVTANKISVSELSALNATIGGWLIDGTRIYNSNVNISNASSHMEFKDSGGTVRTRIKFGDVNIGSPTAYNNLQVFGVGNSAGQTNTTSNSTTYYISATADNTTAPSTNSLTITSAGSGAKVLIQVTVPAIGSFGTASGGSGYNQNPYGSVTLNYRITCTAAGYDSGDRTSVVFAGNSFSPSAGAVSLSISTGATGVTGHVYVITTSLRRYVSMGVSGVGGYLPSGVSATAAVTSLGATNSNFSIAAIQSIAEYGTNGASIGSDDGTYVSMGKAAGSGYTGLFTGNVFVGGTLYAAQVSASDSRVKTNVLDITNGIEKVKALRPVDFQWIENINPHDVRKRSYGFIADEVEEVFPQLVFEKKNNEIEDFKHLDYQSFHGLTIKAVQELVSKVETMESKIVELENKISGSI